MNLLGWFKFVSVCVYWGFLTVASVVPLLVVDGVVAIVGSRGVVVLVLGILESVGVQWGRPGSLYLSPKNMRVEGKVAWDDSYEIKQVVEVLFTFIL